MNQPTTVQRAASVSVILVMVSACSGTSTTTQPSSGGSQAVGGASTADSTSNGGSPIGSTSEIHFAIYLVGQPQYEAGHNCDLAGTQGGVPGAQWTDQKAQQLAADTSINQDLSYLGKFNLNCSAGECSGSCHANSTGQQKLGTQARVVKVVADDRYAAYCGWLEVGKRRRQVGPLRPRRQRVGVDTRLEFKRISNAVSRLRRCDWWLLPELPKRELQRDRCDSEIGHTPRVLS